MVPDVAFDDAEPLVLDISLGSIAREYRDVAPHLEGLGHDVPPGCAGRAEDQELHDARMLAPQAP